MIKKSLSFIIAAGVLTMGISAFAEEQTTDVTVQQDQTQTRERKKDGTGDQDKDRIMKQDHDRTGEHQGSNSDGTMKRSEGSGRGGGSHMGNGRMGGGRH